MTDETDDVYRSAPMHPHRTWTLPDLPRRDFAAVATVCAGVALVVLIGWNPWHFREFDSVPLLVAPTLLAGVLVVAALGLAASGRRPMARAGAGLAMVLVLAAFIRPLLPTLWSSNQRVATSTSSDGRYELVVESWSASIDPAYDVTLRHVHGLFAEEVLVWRGVERFSEPKARFLDADTVEVSTDGVVYLSDFEPGTVRLSTVHCLSPGYC